MTSGILAYAFSIGTMIDETPSEEFLILRYIAGMQPYIATMHWDLTAIWQLNGGKHRTPDMQYTNRAHGQHC